MKTRGHLMFWSAFGAVLVQICTAFAYNYPVNEEPSSLPVVPPSIVKGANSSDFENATVIKPDPEVLKLVINASYFNPSRYIAPNPWLFWYKPATPLSSTGRPGLPDINTTNQISVVSSMTLLNETTTQAQFNTGTGTTERSRTSQSTTSSFFTSESLNRTDEGFATSNSTAVVVSTLPGSEKSDKTESSEPITSNSFTTEPETTLFPRSVPTRDSVRSLATVSSTFTLNTSLPTAKHFTNTTAERLTTEGSLGGSTESTNNGSRLGTVSLISPSQQTLKGVEHGFATTTGRLQRDVTAIDGRSLFHFVWSSQKPHQFTSKTENLGPVTESLTQTTGRLSTGTGITEPTTSLLIVRSDSPSTGKLSTRLSKVTSASEEFSSERPLGAKSSLPNVVIFRKEYTVGHGRKSTSENPVLFTTKETSETSATTKQTVATMPPNTESQSTNLTTVEVQFMTAAENVSITSSWSRPTTSPVISTKSLNSSTESLEEMSIGEQAHFRRGADS